MVMVGERWEVWLGTVYEGREAVFQLAWQQVRSDDRAGEQQACAKSPTRSSLLEAAMKATPSGELTAADKPRTRNSAVRLGTLAGRWHVEGDVPANDNGPAAKWTSEEEAEWLPGECFLVNRWDARAGDSEFRGMTVFGCDADEGYFATFYDNSGHHPTYLLTIDEDTWTLTGEAQRATYEFAPDGESVHIQWEMKGKAGWQPLCDLTARRKKAH
jgi:hypothetical protein